MAPSSPAAPLAATSAVGPRAAAGLVLHRQELLHLLLQELPALEDGRDCSEVLLAAGEVVVAEREVAAVAVEAAAAGSAAPSILDCSSKCCRHFVKEDQRC